MPETATEVTVAVELAVVPSPSWPASLRPQQRTDPFVSAAQVWWLPAETRAPALLPHTRDPLWAQVPRPVVQLPLGRQTRLHSMVLAGQTQLLPLHTPPVGELQLAPVGRMMSDGHAALEPVHVSCASQVPTEGRHTAPGVRSASGGHGAPSPPHVSAASHTSVASRHETPAATLTQLVGPDTVADGIVHTWQVFDGLR